MKILKIMSYVITVPFTLILLFINLSPQFGSNPKKIEKEYYSGYSNYEDGEFKNKEATALFTDEMSFWDFFKTEINREPIKELIPLGLDIKSFISNSSNEIELVWLGHSAFIININGVIILLDPMLGNHAAPVPLPSLKRYSSQLAFDIDKLEKIDFVIYSHDHYDHLDYPTIKKIKDKVGLFIVPLGIGNHLEGWGVNKNYIRELNWDESYKHNKIEFVCLPARHFSGRGPLNRNSTLWSSWAIKSPLGKIYFSGDSGYGSHFEDIGLKHGPFDISLIDCGQYNKAWKFSHMFPEQSVKAAKDLKSEYLIPIHWGAFTLASHSWIEPPEVVSMEAVKLQQKYLIPEIGQILKLGANNKTSKDWWRNFSQGQDGS